MPSSDLILCYHRVRGETSTDGPSRITTSLEAFLGHLELLAKEFEFSSLDEVLAQRKTARRRVALTFDDGYLDNLEVVAPILLSKGIPATFFISSGYGRNYPLFPPELVNAEVMTQVCDRHSPDFATRYWKTLGQIINEPSEDIFWDQIKEMSLRHGTEIVSRDQHARAMQPQEIQSLDRLGFDIGAHSRSHRRLKSISTHEAVEEALSSRASLQNLVNKPVRYFAFPFGQLDDIVPEVIFAWHRLGGSTFSTNPKFVSVRSKGPLAAVPRLSVSNQSPSQLANLMTMTKLSTFGGSLSDLLMKVRRRQLGRL